MNYLINRLKEPSTWRGIILVVAGIFGYQMPPGIQETVIAGGVALQKLLSKGASIMLNRGTDKQLNKKPRGGNP